MALKYFNIITSMQYYDVLKISCVAFLLTKKLMEWFLEVTKKKRVDLEANFALSKFFCLT